MKPRKIAIITNFIGAQVFAIVGRYFSFFSSVILATFIVKIQRFRPKKRVGHETFNVSE